MGEYDDLWDLTPEEERRYMRRYHLPFVAWAIGFSVLVLCFAAMFFVGIGDGLS